MTTGIVATIGAVILILTTSGAKIKGFFGALQRFWLDKIVLDKELSAAVFCYCIDNTTLSRLRAKTYFSCKGVVKATKTGDDSTLAMDILSQSTTVFWSGWKPIITTPGKWVCNPTTNSYERTTNLYLPRFLWNANNFFRMVIQCYDSADKKKEGRFNVTHLHGKNKKAPTVVLDETTRSDHIPNPLQEAKAGRAKLVHYDLSDIVDSTLSDPFDWYAFPDEVMEAVTRARWWYKSRSWYQRKRIPWRRGWTVYGIPGSGKTLLLKCLAQDLDLPVFSFDLTSMSNEEFVNFWSETMIHAPCMVLFEDFDSVFHGRKAVCNDDLSFDCILNSISGIEQADGLFLGLTANDIGQIDAAMGVCDSSGSSSRPGRIDEVLQLNDMEKDCRVRTAVNILDTDEVEDIVEQGEGMTAAQFVEMCNKIILSEQVSDYKRYKFHSNGKLTGISDLVLEEAV